MAIILDLFGGHKRAVQTFKEVEIMSFNKENGNCIPLQIVKTK